MREKEVETDREKVGQDHISLRESERTREVERWTKEKIECEMFLL